MEQKSASLQVPAFTPAPQSAMQPGGGRLAGLVTDSAQAGIQAGKAFVDSFNASLSSIKMPSFTGPGADSGVSDFEKRMDEQIAEIERMQSGLDQNLTTMEANSEKTFTSVGDSGVQAFGRIQTAQNSLSQDSENLTRRIDATKSAVLAAYGAGAMAALQMAKGIAFVTAANEEEAASMVKVVAEAQGYFDLGVGGLHIIKALNDVKRQSALLSTLQATASGVEATALVGQTAATTGATTATLGLNAAMLANPAVIVIAGLAAAALAARAWGQANEKAAKETQAAEQHLAEWRLSRQDREASSTQRRVSVASSNTNEGDNQEIIRQIEELGRARTQLEQVANMPLPMDSSEGLLKRSEEIRDVEEKRLSILRDQATAQSTVIANLQRERDVASSNLQIANQRLESERSALQVTNQSIGALSRMDQARAKRVQQQLDTGQDVRHEDLTFAAGLRGTQISKIAQEQLQKQGEQSGIRVDDRDLKGAQANQRAAQRVAEDSLEEINASIEKGIENRNQLKKLMSDAVDAIGIQGSEIARLTAIIAETKRDIEKRTSLLGGPAWFRIGG